MSDASHKKVFGAGYFAGLNASGSGDQQRQEAMNRALTSLSEFSASIYRDIPARKSFTANWLHEDFLSRNRRLSRRAIKGGLLELLNKGLVTEQFAGSFVRTTKMGFKVSKARDIKKKGR